MAWQACCGGRGSEWFGQDEGIGVGVCTDRSEQILPVVCFKGKWPPSLGNAPKA